MRHYPTNHGLGESAAAEPPRSITTTWINLVALGHLAFVVVMLHEFQISNVGYRVLAVFAAIALPVIVLERLFTRTGLRGKARQEPKQAKILRVGLKLLGTVASWGMLLLLYWVFPHFRDQSGAFHAVFNLVWLPCLMLAPFYIWYVDGRTDNPNDEYLELGRLILGQWHQVNTAALKQHALAWIVKLFFLQFILRVLADRMNDMLSGSFAEVITRHSYGFFDLFVDAMFLVDVSFAAVGYLLTLRLFDSHVRSTEPTTLGWVACLICYYPFLNAIEPHLIAYDDNFYWGAWLASWPAAKLVWAAMIMVCVSIYALATVQLGIRFGNLSHRGIVTNGVYSLMKHPAYVAKNASFWLISIPFVSQVGIGEAFRMSIMLLCLNAIYYLRAKTEERHLARDPAYLQYCSWIEREGLIARLRRAWLAASEIDNARTAN